MSACRRRERVCGSGVLCLLSAATCVAQSNPPVTITYHLTFTEVSAPAPYAPVALPNGLLEPGEGARFEINASISPPPGTYVSYPPPTGGSSGAGHIGGFWSGDLNLTGSAGAGSSAGSWILSANTSPPGDPNRLGVIPPFAAGFPFANGYVNSNGSGVTDIQPAQFGPDSMLLNSANPTPVLWRGIWRPDIWLPRGVLFELSPGTLGIPSSVYAVDFTVTLPISLQASSTYSGITVQVVPSPAAVVLLLAGCKRRRRPQRSPQQPRDHRGEH
jgi:hypothetical protein